MCRQWNSSKAVWKTCGATLTSVFLCACGVHPDARANVWQELRTAPACNTYKPMTDGQLNQAEFLFTQILEGANPHHEQFANGWEKLGYELVEVSVAGPGWVGLRETESPCRGNGVYLLNISSPGPLVVQAPHAYYDLHTGTITAGLMRAGVAILAWNSAKRDTKSEHGSANADLAKRSDSLFVALTRALIKSYPHGRLVQIHGFDNQRRRTAAGNAAAVILSSGTRWGTRAVDFVARCLRPIIDGPVLRYPTDVTELGATTNYHGQTLRRRGHEGFIHVEINRPTRAALQSDPLLLARFSACMGSGA